MANAEVLSTRVEGDIAVIVWKPNLFRCGNERCLA
jgi:hypothetical protein